MVYTPPQKSTVVLSAAQKEKFFALADLAAKVRKFCLFRFEENKDLTKLDLESLLRDRKPFPVTAADTPVVLHAISNVYIQWKDYQKGLKRKPGVYLPDESFQVRVWNPSMGAIDKDGFCTPLLGGKVEMALPGSLKNPSKVSAISVKNDRGVFKAHISMSSAYPAPTVENMKEEY